MGNYRRYHVFFDFRFTENMILQSIAENPENLMFTLSVFTKMLFSMQCLYDIFILLSALTQNEFLK